MRQAPKLLGALRERAAALAESVPCLALLAGVVDGSIWPLAFGELGLFVQALLALPGLLLAALLLKRGRFIGFAVCAAAGFASALWCARVPSDDYTLVFGGRSACAATVEARVVDESCCGAELAWLPNPKYVQMEVLRLKLSDDSAWIPASGLFAARLPGEFKPGYADAVRLRGAFFTIETPASEAAFDYGRFLELRSIRRAFDVSEASELARGTGFMRALFEFRNAALNKLCEGVASDDSKRLIAALVFGCQQGVSWESRADFLKSGTIHILSVSGLHVAMVATILALALRWAPFRPRHLLVPLLTLLYSLMTGMQAPSFRAFAMLATWCVLRAALLSTNAFNSTLLAALLLLLWRPSQILDPGFQYSFVAVFFLLGSASLFGEWKACFAERSRWIPPHFDRPLERFREKAVEWLAVSVATCFVAWLASVGLSLFYQGLGVPFSIPANMALIPTTWCVFATFALQGVLFWIPGFMALSGAFMDFFLKTMNSTCAFFADAGGGVSPRPPGWSVALFLALLATLFLSRSRKLTLCAAMALTATLSLWFCWSFFETPEVAVLHGGGAQEPAVAISDPRTGFALAVNVPDFEAARQLSAQLGSRGLSELDALLLSSPAKDFCGGAKFLLSFMKVDLLAVPRFPARAESAKEAFETVLAKGAQAKALKPANGEASTGGALFSASFKKGEWMVECLAPELNIKLSLSETGNGERVLEIKRPGEQALTRKLPNTLERTLQVFRLPAQ